MRLNLREIACIEQAARESFVPRTRVSLFGSRLDDARRGGDIDLLIETPSALAPDDLVARRQRFIARLYRLLGEQRIDVVIVPSGCPDDRPFVRAARLQGCQLTEVK